MVIYSLFTTCHSPGSICLYYQRYLSGSPRLAASPEELPNLGYLHPHTCFLSRLTWHWMGPLLAYGYRNILQLADLGSLPQVTMLIKYNKNQVICSSSLISSVVLFIKRLVMPVYAVYNFAPNFESDGRTIL